MSHILRGAEVGAGAWIQLGGRGFLGELLYFLPEMRLHVPIECNVCTLRKAARLSFWFPGPTRQFSPVLQVAMTDDTRIVSLTRTTCITRAGYSWNLWPGVCRPVLKTLTLFQTKLCNFAYPIQTWLSKCVPHFRPCDVWQFLPLGFTAYGTSWRPKLEVCVFFLGDAKYATTCYC